ncbi:IclR family transcriptional regulator [Geosporobacter ferrireducens]|uniref:Glycerol operon regulatory protein n=1 Tax=Geosporobacter ferrireducens TaxID=1424294 RepID=A0A1D8GK87_9FIRM|nr:IclR family transcriptional regulator [Geosporobacter ferrireducens]AOT71272.1 pectin degradation protein [Geosporobacter ferrireducens]MTI58085.1 IclR family transcriptional regulator [Geosporobacter ferrireducens]
MEKTKGVIVQSVARALEILQCFSGNTIELGISEIADAMELSKSTVYGLVNTLVVKGYLEQSQQSKKYRLGIKLFEFGNLVQKRMDLRNEAKVFCEILAEKYRNTIHLAAHYEGEIIYIDKVDIPDSVIAYSQVGKRAPMHCTGVGKAILAYLDTEYIENYVLNKPLNKMTENTIINPQKLLEELQIIKERGYAIDDEEIEIGLRCVAAPIFNHKGYPVAAISVSGPYRKMNDEFMKEVAKDVQSYVQQISERLGYSNK